MNHINPYHESDFDDDAIDGNDADDDADDEESAGGQIHVWVLFARRGEETDLLGVFASETGAETAKREICEERAREVLGQEDYDELADDEEVEHWAFSEDDGEAIFIEEIELQP
jgi:ATP-dependent protease HslVU (ClpYQ) ATPase subunit